MYLIKNLCMNKNHKSFHSDFLYIFLRKFQHTGLIGDQNFPFILSVWTELVIFFSDKTYLCIRANKTQLLLALMFFGVPWLEERELHLKVFRCQPKLYSRESQESLGPPPPNPIAIQSRRLGSKGALQTGPNYFKRQAFRNHVKSLQQKKPSRKGFSFFQFIWTQPSQLAIQAQKKNLKVHKISSNCANRF